MKTDSTVLVYTTSGMSLPHLAIEREVLEKKLFQFNRKILLKCSGGLNTCYFNPVHNLLGCALCQSRTEANIKSRYKFDRVYNIQKKGNNYDNVIIEITSLTELMAYKYKEIEIGRGIGSSLISITRNSKLNIYNYTYFIENSLKQAMQLVDQIEKIVNDNNVSDVILFNGRFFEHFPILSYCLQNKINYYTHEKGANFNKYQLIKNHTVHSISYRKRQIEEVWNNYQGNNNKIADQWFLNKRKGIISTETNFTLGQTKGLLPKGFDKSFHNITIFNSSEDEFKSIKEWDHELFDTQNEIIIKIAKSLKSNKKIRIYLRFHPNLKGIAREQIDEIIKAKLSNVIIISPESKISTYRLMSNSNKILSFGSRTSIEAAYWGTPSIIYGKSFYESLDSLYKPANYTSLIELLENFNLKAKSGIDLLKAALFLQERGNQLEFAEIINKNNVYYKNKRLKKHYPLIIFYFFCSLSNLGIWRNNFKEFYNKKLSFKDLLKI